MLGADLRLAGAVWMRNFTCYRHTWYMNVLPNFFEPLLYLLGMGLGVGSYMQAGIEGKQYLAFIGPGLMAAAAMNGASFEVTYNMFVKMNFARLYDAYLATPVAVEDIVLGEILWATTRGLAYGLAFLTVLCGLTVAGWPIITSPAAAAVPLALALTGALFAAIGQVFTALARQIDLYSYYFTLFLTPLFLFSGIFFPVSRFPHGEAIAWWTPLFHAVRLARGLAQGPLGAQHAVDAAWMAAAIVAAGLVVPRILRGRIVG
jgi:lipooligosaccharide transport system permease protein